MLRYAECYGNMRYVAIIKILLNTGLRVSELCALRLQHISISDRKGELAVTSGKGNKYRTVHLNKDARQAFNYLGSPQHTNSDHPVFLGQRGPLSPRR